MNVGKLQLSVRPRRGQSRSSRITMIVQISNQVVRQISPCSKTHVSVKPPAGLSFVIILFDLFGDWRLPRHYKVVGDESTSDVIHDQQ